MLTSVLIGSRPNWPDGQTLTSPSGTISASLGALYLDHPTAALSMLEQVKGLSGVSDAYIRKDGLVVIVMSGSTALTWGAATILRDLLGFTGDRTAATSHVADVQSVLLWVPLRKDQPGPDGLIDDEGETRNLIDVSAGRNGEQVTVLFAGNKERLWRWTYVPKAKFKTADEEPAEYRAFFQEVLVPTKRFLVYRGVDMDDSDTDPASYSSPFGPYQADMQKMSAKLEVRRSRGFERVDRLFDIDVEAVKVAEYA